MELFPLVVRVAAALCGLVAGFLFGFAVVAMPGLENLSDRGGNLGSFSTSNGNNIDHAEQWHKNCVYCGDWK